MHSLGNCDKRLVYHLSDVCFQSNLYVTNASFVTPTVQSPTGTAFTVSCSTGYTPSVASGTLECGGSGDWLNRPTCDGV